MLVSAQVSVYPLGQQELGPPIQRAIDMLQAAGLTVEPGSMSTVVAGEAGIVFNTLREVFSEIASQGHVVMTLTFSNACPVPAPHV